MVYEGFATMYMRTCMSKANLPVEGKCKVTGKNVELDFKFTGLEFDLPCPPMEGRNDFDFKIRGDNDSMTLTIGWLSSLKCFTGVGKLDDGTTILTFNFFTHNSPMRFLPNSPFPL